MKHLLDDSATNIVFEQNCKKDILIFHAVFWKLSMCTLKDEHKIIIKQIGRVKLQNQQTTEIYLKKRREKYTNLSAFTLTINPLGLQSEFEDQVKRQQHVKKIKIEAKAKDDDKIN